MAKPSINPEAVASLLETTRELARAEEQRGRSFNERAGSLLGFTGIILALAGAQGGFVVRADLGGVGKPLVGALLLLSVGAAVLSAFASVRVLLPRDLWHIDMRYIEQFPTMRFITLSSTFVEGSIMRGLIRQMADEREANNAKWSAIRRAFRWLLVSVSLLALEVSILALRTIGA